MAVLLYKWDGIGIAHINHRYVSDIAGTKCWYSFDFPDWFNWDIEVYIKILFASWACWAFFSFCDHLNFQASIYFTTLRFSTLSLVELNQSVQSGLTPSVLTQSDNSVYWPTLQLPHLFQHSFGWGYISSWGHLTRLEYVTELPILRPWGKHRSLLP